MGPEARALYGGLPGETWRSACRATAMYPAFAPGKPRTHRTSISRAHQVRWLDGAARLPGDARSAARQAAGRSA